MSNDTVANSSSDEAPTHSLFEAVFGASFEALPASWQRLHLVTGRHVYLGGVEVIRGEGLVAGLLCWMMGLPRSGTAEMKLVIEKLLDETGHSERWARHFGASEFSTVLTLPKVNRTSPLSDGYILHERFGPIRFIVGLEIDKASVKWRLLGWRFLSLPLPAFLVPRSETVEFVDEAGRYRFDIDLSLIGFGRLIAYRGWLVPDGSTSISAPQNSGK